MSATPTTPATAGAGAAQAASRFSVELLIRDFQVTATNRLIASSYAASDAREFIRNWNYMVGKVSAATGQDATLGAGTLPIAVKVKDSVPDSGRERLYSCDAFYSVVVDAVDRYSAGEAALRLVCEPARLPAQLAAYRDQAYWEKLMPVARAPLDHMVEVLQRRGFDATLRTSGGGDAHRFMAIDVAVDGEQVGTLALIKHASYTAEAERPIVSPALHFVGAPGIEASSIPADHPDIWFNDARITAADVACLDVDAFDSFFDLVIEQIEEACAEGAPAAHA